MNIAILGLGTIGSGVFEIAQKQESLCVKRILEIRFKNELTCDNIDAIALDPEIETVVETMGGLHPAYEFAKRVIECGKHFVTANKYLVSVYGAELCALARKNGTAFLYGPACGGGIGYLANMKIAAGIDHLTELGGILNGTTNFILDAMQSTGKDYADALAEAQALGYAERDPSSDVDGLDTQRKLMLSCGVGFNAMLNVDDIDVRGIAAVTAADAAYAKKHGKVIRLCARAERSESGLSAYVEPVMVASNAPEASILKNVNYAWYKGDCYGLMGYTGQGAGKLPTASNVIRDVLSIAEGQRYMTREDCAATAVDNSTSEHAYYLRLPMTDTVPACIPVSTEETDGVCNYIITRPVSVKVMHDCFRDRKEVFFAGLREDA